MDGATPEAERLHQAGLGAYAAGDAAAAVPLLTRAVRLRPLAAHVRANLANALRAAGRPRKAVAALRVARRLRPASAEIASNLGAMLTDLGHLDEALATLAEAVALDPALAEAHFNLGHALARSGDIAGAVDRDREALRLRPGFVDAAFNLAHHLAAVGRSAEAEAAYRAVLRLDPAHPAALNNLGALLQDSDRLEEAEASFATALARRPADHAIRCNLAAALLATGRRHEAAARYAEVLAVTPGHGGARLGRLLTHLPIVAVDAADAAAGRRAYARDLVRLVGDARRARHRAGLVGVEAGWPCFLPYQGGNDRALAAAHGALRADLAAPPASAVASGLPARPRPGEPIRLGLVSGFFRDHTVHSLFLEGWLGQLDRSRFRLFGYHTGTRRDGLTTAAAAACEHFVDGPLPLAAWTDAIAADAPHALIYPEIGLDPMAARLATQRLAPLQCAAWGHPVTTGLPTIDVFLSGAGMEPPGAAAHYTEALVALPHLGIFCEPRPPPPTGLQRGRFGLRPDAVVYWSGQNLPKYHPDHDVVFPRIAAAVPGCQFVFTAFGRGRAMTELFATRLDRAFARHGLRAAEHVVILPTLTQREFVGAIGLCDVVLDTIGWSGGKSTLDALATDPAIVTLAGGFMRGRHTAAILGMMGQAGTVVGNLDDYVALAIRLGRDPAARAAIRAGIAANKHRVWRDRSAIQALQAFLEAAVATRPWPAPAATPAAATARPAASAGTACPLNPWT